MTPPRPPLQGYSLYTFSQSPYDLIPALSFKEREILDQLLYITALKNDYV